MLRKQSWQLQLDHEEATTYLVTLNTRRQTQPELHLIPVPALAATNWTEHPEWLSDLGVVSDNNS